LRIVRVIGFVFLGVALVFVASSIFLLNGVTWAFLLLFAGLSFGVDYFSKKYQLQRKSNLILAIIILGILFPMFAPVIQTSPSGGSFGTVCARNICSNMTSWASITEYFACIGAGYEFDAINGLQMGFGTGCVHVGPFG